LRYLQDLGVSFRSLTEPIDTTHASGRLLVQLLGAFAEFERSMIAERCEAGRRAAMARGVKFGRPHMFDEPQRQRLAKRVISGETRTALAREHGCSVPAICNAIQPYLPPDLIRRRARRTMQES
jgi:DNA invertase Pin-like site-specific DNA recombinase